MDKKIVIDIVNVLSTAIILVSIMIYAWNIETWQWNYNMYVTLFISIVFIAILAVIIEIVHMYKV